MSDVLPEAVAALQKANASLGGEYMHSHVLTKEQAAALLTALPKHSGGCSNQNVLNPAGAYLGVQECGCTESKPVRAEGLHCATCQCNKLHPTPPVPKNPRSKSWHENALTEPPKS